MSEGEDFSLVHAKRQARANKPPPLRFASGIELRAFRQKQGLNQLEFWSAVGVTQSGGSRYESGRKVPTPVRMLLTVAYGTPKQADVLVAWLRKHG